MKIRAKNFRGFKDTGLLDLKPITILVGSNSSGKSSFLRILPLLRQSFEKRIAGPILWNDRLVDFGSFKETLRKKSSENIELTFEVPYYYFHEKFSSPPENPIPKPEYLKDIRVTISLLIAMGEKRSFLKTYKATFAHGKIEMNFDQNGQGISLQINDESFLQNLKDRDPSFRFFLEGLKIDLRYNGIYIDNSLLSKSLKKEKVPEYESEKTIQHLCHYWLFVSDEKKLKEELKAFISDQITLEEAFTKLKEFAALYLQEEIDYIVRYLNHSLSLMSDQTSYIGPFRTAPKRSHLLQRLIVDELEPNGGNMAAFLYSLDEAQKKDLSNWLYKYFRIQIEIELNGRYLEIFVTNSKKERFNLADLGFGFSQLLPVAIQTWLAGRSSKKDNENAQQKRVIKQLIIEQPEIHLHPRYQSFLGDMFVGIIKTQKDLNFTMLIETHSYALIDRIGDLVQEKKISKDKISILLFIKEDGLCEIKKSGYTARGLLKNWPVGFFSSYEW